MILSTKFKPGQRVYYLDSFGGRKDVKVYGTVVHSYDGEKYSEVEGTIVIARWTHEGRGIDTYTNEGWMFENNVFVDTLDFTKPVQTKDGKPVRILCTDAEGSYSLGPVVGLLNGGALHWYQDGRFGSQPSLNDLEYVPPRPAPKKKVRVEGLVRMMKSADGGIVTQFMHADTPIPQGWTLIAHTPVCLEGETL